MRKIFLTTTTLAYVLHLHLAAQHDRSLYDPRDGKEYQATIINLELESGIFVLTEWLKDNLNYQSSKSDCYKESGAYCYNYGRLYDWKEAQKVCPSGWHLSTLKEWESILTKYQHSSSYTEGGLSGLDIRMSGTRQKDGQYGGAGSKAEFWISKSTTMESPASIAIDQNNVDLKKYVVDGGQKKSVRCIRNYSIYEQQLVVKY